GGWASAARGKGSWHLQRRPHPAWDPPTSSRKWWRSCTPSRRRKGIVASRWAGGKLAALPGPCNSPQVKIGVFGINFGLAANVDTMLGLARAAEQAGLDSVWTGEHVVLPSPRVPPSPSEPETPFLDPAVALAYVAAETTRIRLGTGVIILPQRNPVVLAKELASVDVLSRGRLIFGLGSGYLEPEFRAIGAPFSQRGAVTDEAIRVLKALWTMERPAFNGRFFRFAGIDAHPRPVQRPHPPIVVGGMSEFGARRAARFGNGWYGFLTDLEATRRSLGWI